MAPLGRWIESALGLLTATLLLPFLRMRWMRRLSRILFACAFLEVLCWALSWLLLTTTGQWLVPAPMTRHFHPWWNPRYPSPGGTMATETQYDPYAIYWYRPHLTEQHFDDRKQHYLTNRQGVVVHDRAWLGVDLERPPERPRIFIVGGSTVLGSASQTTLAAYLERALQDRYEVYTAGMSGYNSTNELMVTLTKVLYWHPSLVITFDGVNDAVHSISPATWSRHQHARGQEVAAFVDAQVYRAQGQWFNPLPLIDFLGRSYTVRTLWKPLDKLGLPYPDLATLRARATAQRHTQFQYRPEAVRVYLMNLESIGAAAIRQGVRVLHILQPTLSTEVQPSDPAWDRVALRLPEASDQQAFVSAMQAFYTEARRQWAIRQATNHPDRWWDASTLFDGQPLSEIYYDDCHYHDAWTGSIAQAIARQL